ncbi:hypothetical protein [Pseudonocardia oceani]|uniref:RNA-binding S4 domain-containing protein n=1 Tax=Pseudonocardia oceani TaxID=2792013 RepID=A0ABS6UGU1_9PSEU|nr:hypothetical protein [Pseudonocardia oceani]MBW0090516.1 hypothetical protein [Pseudonocardia oceani]MBW0131141.1 hypothetical protein [Pseudonocardia oceani]MBW0132597.1 hypothetical protein [Pseudonocardia oceani]
MNDRLRAAGISQTSIDAHFADGVLRVDGDPATALDQPAPKPARIVIHEA